MGQARSSRAFSIFHFIFVSSFYWASLLISTTGSTILFSTAVLKRTQRDPALHYGLRSKILLWLRASHVPAATTTASTFPCQWRPAGRLDVSPRPALLMILQVLQSCFQLRSSSTSSVPLHYSTVCAPKGYFGHEHHLLEERLILLTFSRQWRPSGRLNLSPRHALLLVLQSCFTLRSSSTSSVPLHYSTVFAPRITSATSITCSRSDYYCFYIPSLVAAVLEDWFSSPCTTTGSAVPFSIAVGI
ncbi:uncharacterized protein [Dermacentor albipictus]|uniref:uncharacterized protein n=1 Tax=Dermacentor albipictus TaxID=60249 RepID=UPI0038FCFF0E